PVLRRLEVGPFLRDLIGRLERIRGGILERFLWWSIQWATPFVSGAHAVRAWSSSSSSKRSIVAVRGWTTEVMICFKSVLPSRERRGSVRGPETWMGVSKLRGDGSWGITTIL